MDTELVKSGREVHRVAREEMTIRRSCIMRGYNRVFHQPVYNLSIESGVRSTIMDKTKKGNVSIFEDVMSYERIIS